MTEAALGSAPALTQTSGLPERRYQLTVCSRPKLVWFRNAKVGTRTLYRLLRDASVEFEIEHEYHVPFDSDLYKDHYKFAIVRNPWGRLVSGWNNKIRGREKPILKLSKAQKEAFMDFGTFAKYVATLDGDRCNVHFRRQSALISLKEVDYIARFERYEEEVRRLFSILGLHLPETIPHKNRSRTNHSYHHYYTEETRDLVREFYRPDIEAFGYSFDER